MSSIEIIQALGDNADGLKKFINKMVGHEMLYLTSDLGLYHLYTNENGHDELIIEGRNSIGDLTRLVLTLREILRAIKI